MRQSARGPMGQGSSGYRGRGSLGLLRMVFCMDVSSVRTAEVLCLSVVLTTRAPDISFSLRLAVGADVTGWHTLVGAMLIVWARILFIWDTMTSVTAV